MKATTPVRALLLIVGTLAFLFTHGNLRTVVLLGVIVALFLTKKPKA